MTLPACPQPNTFTWRERQTDTNTDTERQTQTQRDKETETDKTDARGNHTKATEDGERKELCSTVSNLFQNGLPSGN